MPSREFVHLHLHTQFSLLDGAIKIKELPKYAKELGYKAVAITDHGNLFGSFKFYKALREEGLKPIIGIEAYITKGSRLNKLGKGSEDNYTDSQNHHIVLLAKNDVGLKNLMKLSSIGYLEGFHYKPRIDLEVLEKHKEGLICLTACLKGLPTYYASKGEEEEAERWLLKLIEIFGKEDLYVELQPHDLEEQITANRILVRLAKKHGLKLIATCDVHYLKPEDKVAHNILTALQMKKTYKELLQSPAGQKLQRLELHFASPEEVWRRFENKFDGWEEALLNTLEVAEKVSEKLEYFENTEYKMPVYEVPKGETLESYFRKLAIEGLKKRIKERGVAKDEKVYWERLEYELDVISKMGFPGYFLIVQDFINWAKNNGIPVGPGRGSAGGSLVAYALGITDIDPIKHDLLFERFLNPDRISMPDIDVDFCMERRDDVIEYVAQKYGRDSVCQIITYNVLKSKSVIRDVCRALGVPLEKADRLAKLIPQGETQGSQLSLEEMVDWSIDQLKEKYGERPDIEDAVQKFRRMLAEDPSLRQAVEIGKKLDGLTRHTGFHAAGVVIAPQPLIELVPLFARKEKDKETKKEKFIIATQYDMGVLEEIGLLKMDFLGLKTLTELDLMKKMVKDLYGEEIDFHKLDYSDPKVYELLKSGRTTGVFQLESRGMQNLLIRLKPDRFDDIIAVLALYRPGPLKSGLVDSFVRRKHGEEPITYEFSELEPILKETYGIWAYQEQIMKMSQILAGFTPGEADTLRKGIGKKRCLTADTLVLLEDGSTVELIKLIENFEYHHKGKVRCRFCNSERTYKNGDRGNKKSFYCTACGKTFTVEIFEKPLKVLALDESLKFEPSEIVEVHRNGKDTVYKLRLRYSGTIEATEKHLFLTPEGWKPLKLLKKGDRIATPLTFRVSPRNGLTPEEAKFVGYLLGDGYLKGVVFYNSDGEILKDYTRLVKKLFPQSRVKLYNNSNGGKIVYIYKPEREGYRRSVKDFLRSLGLKTQKAEEKFVPERILVSDDETVSVFLGALWSTDGSIVLAKNYEYAELITKSKKLALQVLLLLRRLGITASLKEKKVPYKGEKRTYHKVEIRGKENLLRFAEVVGKHLVGRKKGTLKLLVERLRERTHNYRKETIPSYFWRKLFETAERKGLKRSTLAKITGERCGIKLDLNVSPERFRKYAELVEEEEFLKLCNSDIFWDTVEEIEFVGVKETYDLTVENSNFVANACVVHNSDIIAKMKTKFIEGAVKRGKDRKKVEELWNSIEKFASYSFNKSHSTAYAYISYWTAYMKTHYPGVFFAVKLSTERNENKFISLIKDAKLFGFELLPPDINESDIHFTIEERNGKQYIRYGLAKIKGVGEEAAKAIKEAKQKFGRFKSLADFVKKVDKRKVNKKVIEALIEAGAFDFTGESREELLKKVQSQEKLTLAVGQNSLFTQRGGKEKNTQRVESFLEILKRERQLLGFYISGHPLDKYEHLVKKADKRIEELEEVEFLPEVRLAGVVVDFQEKRTRSGKYMAIFNLIDKTGILECVVFPDTYENIKHKLEEDKVVLVEGDLTTDAETESKKLIVRTVLLPEEVEKETEIKILLPGERLNEAFLKKLAVFLQTLSDGEGGAPTFIVLKFTNGSFYEIELGKEFWVVPNANNLNLLKQKLGNRVEIL